MRIVKHYEWGEFLDYVDWQGDEDGRASQTKGDAEWYGTPDFKSAMELARFGWADKIGELKEWEMKEAPPLLPAYRAETRYDIAGGQAHIGRFLGNQPDCMMRRVIENGFNIPALFVNVVILSSASSFVGAGEIMKYGVGIAGIVKSLELRNVRTRIDILEHVIGSNDHGSTYQVTIRIKDFTDFLYLEKLMFPIAHPSFNRRLMFSEQERNGAEVREAFGFYERQGYGKPLDQFDDDENTLYFNGVQFDREKINQKIANILRQRESK
ncbi:MAG: hypothetical protein LBL21_03830 [Rickettsiales bacterium]|nr:hypothetical protein [Rickettsiales bacterium]